MTTASRLRDPSDPRFDAFFSIYEVSLPASERKKRHEIAALLKREDYHILVFEIEAEVVAFSIVYVSIADDVALLEYMATQPGRRNAGLGALAFSESLKQASGKPMLVEVDSPRETSDDQQIRTRRQNFYKRNGCRQLVGVDYILPLKAEGKPPIMDLLVHPNGHEGEHISKDTAQRWLIDIYTHVYDQKADDPRIENMLAPLPNAITLA